MLKGAKARAEAAGIPLDVGEFPEVDTSAEDEDPQRIVNLTAHAVARVADRFSWVRKLSRHMEGTERKAGLLSDIAAVTFALYKRNPAVMESLATQFRADLQAQRAARQAPANGGSHNPTPEGVPQ